MTNESGGFGPDEDDSWIDEEIEKRAIHTEPPGAELQDVGDTRRGLHLPKSTDYAAIINAITAEETAKRRAWIEAQALIEGKPHGCLGEEACPGWTWQWKGPLDRSKPRIGFVHRPCEVGDHELRWAERPTNPDRGTWEDPPLSEQDNVTKQYHQSLLDSSGLPKRGHLRTVTLDSYALTVNGKEPWYREFMEWVDKEWYNGPGRQGALLLGTYGVGKTGIVVAMGREILARLPMTVLYLNVVDFVDQVGRAWVERSGAEYNLVEKMKQKRVLILNDLGAGHGTAKDWDERSPMRYLFEILNYRYDNDLPTLITSNCDSVLQLKGIIGDRNYNRVYATCKLFTCTGVNLRHGVDDSEGQETPMAAPPYAGPRPTWHNTFNSKPEDDILRSIEDQWRRKLEDGE